MAGFLTMDAEQLEHHKRFYRAVLDTALDDVRRIIAGLECVDVVDPDAADPKLRVLDHAERQQLLDDTLAWFFDGAQSECSLDVVCDAIGIDPDVVRRGVKEIMRGYRPIRPKRRNVSLAARLYVLDSLDRGASPQEIAKDLGTDDSTIRKIRLKRRSRYYRADGRIDRRSTARPRKDQATARRA